MRLALAVGILALCHAATVVGCRVADVPYRWFGFTVAWSMGGAALMLLDLWGRDRRRS